MPDPSASMDTDAHTAPRARAAAAAVPGTVVGIETAAAETAAAAAVVVSLLGFVLPAMSIVALCQSPNPFLVWLDARELQRQKKKKEGQDARS
jgi:hypothetical protein